MPRCSASSAAAWWRAAPSHSCWTPCWSASTPRACSKRGRQRTDSTAVLAAIRTLNRLECVGETLRHALNSLAVVAPDWLRPPLDPAWAERYGPRVDEYRLPKGQAERTALAEQIGRDGVRLLTAIYAPTAPAWLRLVPAVETLRRVWVQQSYAPREDGTHRWRTGDDLPPAAQMINSPHTPRRATPPSAAPAGSATRSRSPRPAIPTPRT